MPFIVMIGPHAIGKTTAVRRYASRYRRLTVVMADSQIEIVDRSEKKIRLWGGSVNEKQSRMEYHKRHQNVVLIESGRNYAGILTNLSEDDKVVVLTCPAEVGLAHMIARRQGKPTSEYWTADRLDYEFNRRPMNWARRLESMSRVFSIQDRVVDWPVVDNYMYGVIAKMLNTQNRKSLRLGRL